jgi:S1-C subfamily serine protease
MRNDRSEPLTQEVPSHYKRFQPAWLKIKRAFPFALGVLASLIALLLYSKLNAEPEPLTQDEISELAFQAMASATPSPAISAQVYQVILPSLVIIRAEIGGEDREDGYSIGSGVVINYNGEILTALHVVQDALLIDVIFADGTQSLASVAAADPENDIAVLLPDQPPTIFLPATISGLGGTRIGDEVFAVGNPLGLTGSMSAGVISGFDRTFTPVNSDFRLEGLIQFDAAVNPGNSGGPLLNRYGQVIGIVTGLINPTEQDVFIGIGFAVPINVAASAAGGPAQ